MAQTQDVILPQKMNYSRIAGLSYLLDITMMRVLRETLADWRQRPGLREGEFAYLNSGGADGAPGIDEVSEARLAKMLLLAGISMNASEGRITIVKDDLIDAGFGEEMVAQLPKSRDEIRPGEIAQACQDVAYWMAMTGRPQYARLREEEI